MSKQSWLDEFYPIEANSSELKTNLKRVQHSLQKWRGLRPAALLKHNVHVMPIGSDVHAADGRIVLRVDGFSCALCDRHADGGMFGGELGCSSCPLSRARGGCRCDWAKEREDKAPWQEWTYNHNPEPMIKYLEMAENALLKEAARRK